MQFSTLKSARNASLFGFLSSLALGCVISVGDGGKPGSECPEDNNHLEGDKCYCDAGYSWCKPSDNDDLSCCVDTSDTTNNPSNNTSNDDATEDLPTGGTSDATTDQPTSGTTGPTPSNCVVEEAPPASCDPEMGEAYLCLQASDASCGVEGSQHYICENGMWVVDNESGDENCKFDLDNDDAFSYGCQILNGNVIDFVCGVGPGTACSNDEPSSCANDKDVLYCDLGKLTLSDCLIECQTIPDENNATYDFGYCTQQDDVFQCICCDEGVDDCPLGSETSTSDGESSTSDGESSSG